MEHQTVTLKGVVERITYTNPDNGYTIARFQAGGRFGLVTLVGVALIVLILFFPKGLMGTIRERWLPWLP